MRLIDCFSDVLGFTLEQVEAIGQGRQPEYDELRLGIEKRLADRAGDYVAGGYSREQYQEAKFAVVAFIDEAVLLSDWAHKTQWSKELLQKVHFNTANGGAEFFERLDGLSPFNPGERDIREVYFYCLSLGFVGRFYRPGDKTKLEEIRHATFRLLAGDGDGVDKLQGVALFPDAVSKQPVQGKAKHRRDLRVLWFGLPVLGVLAVYFLMRWDVLQVADNLASRF